ncbi:FecR domain-containing protein, partial [Bradyrhizobium sp.]|uniref:FecR domain-containing protein n=1 Tax=Bradyrhizobium sp. TaxID=376 RepID=UPI003C7184A5
MQLEGHSLFHHDHAESDSFSFHSPSQFNHADAVTIPDAHLLFSGDYARSGNDLIISDHLQRFVLPNYFSGEKRPVLVSPEGAQLDSRFVEALTGHVAYAQAGAAAQGAKVVGHVVNMTGSASIVRNGVAVVANTGDTLYQSDVVQTGSNSTLGLVLDDGTAFNLSANARFMLNDFNYDPTSTSNNSLLSLLQGAATFVAGQVAKTGGMEVGTPVAVVGIRGTAVLLDINSVDGQVSISVADQQDREVHSVQVFKCVPAGQQGVCSAGDLIGTILSNGPSLRLTPAANFEVITQEIAKTPTQVTQEFSSFQQVLGTYDAGKLLYPSLPQHTENTNQNNNSNTGATKAAMGSPPMLPSEPPTTTVFSDVSNTKGQVVGSLVPAMLPINSGNVVGNASNASLNPSSDSSQVTFGAVLLPQSPVAITNTGGTTNLPSVTITGTAGVAYAGTTVTLLDTYNGVTTQVGTTTVSPGGVWTANVALRGEGVNSIVAQDASANSTSAPIVFTLDTKPPSVTITSSGGPTGLATQTISGNVAAAAGEAAVGSTVRLFDTLSGVTTQVGTAPVGAGGNWSTTVKLLGNGTHSVVAQDTDAVGNTGASTPVTFTLAAPLMVTIDPVDGNNVITFAEAHAAGGVPLSGTVTGLAANSTFQVTVTDNGVTKSYTASVNGAGTGWSATIPSSDAVALANGGATVSAQVTD